MPALIFFSDTFQTMMRCLDAIRRGETQTAARLKSLHVHINDLVAASFGAAPQLFIRAIACHKERKRRQRLAHT